MFNLGGPEILIIALIIFLIFGGKKLTEFARGLGKTSKELKKAKRELETAMDETKENVNKTLNNMNINEEGKQSTLVSKQDKVVMDNSAEKVNQ